jgi:hypothetical protein
MLSPRRWRAPHLLGAWVAYWVLLALVALGRPLLMLREITSLPDRRGSANLSFGDAGFDAKLVADGATVWHGQASLTAVLLWLVVPPLLIWAAWLAARPRPRAAPGVAGTPPRELGAPGPERDVPRPRERAERPR